tara:strand:- start:1180 stop:1311 length:132 start_codon:yes stop_codon:yes gene_type:complete
VGSGAGGEGGGCEEFKDLSTASDDENRKRYIQNCLNIKNNRIL